MKILFTSLVVFVSLWTSATPPTSASTGLWFGAIDGGYFNVGWTSGNGARRIMICKAGSDVTFVPQNGVDYDANTEFGLGQQVAPGEFVVYDHFSSSFFLTGLTAGTQYFFKIFEYNGAGTTTEYLTSSFLAGNKFTSGTPILQTSGAVFSNITSNSVIVNWVNGDGGRRLIVVREGSPVNADPVNNQPYNVSFAFGNGATIGAGNYTVYASSGVGTSITNLQPGKTYFFSFYEYNGNSQPQYKTPAYTASVTTRSVPTVASSNLIITKTDGKELSLGWSNGNGQRRIIIAKQSSDIISTPANGTDYNSNTTFGLGQQLGTGEFVVYDDNFNATTITGLNPATTYYFKIFEYDGSGSSTSYLTCSFASVNGPTALIPSVQSMPLAATNITSSSIRIPLTPGNGRARMIIGRKNAAVNVSPVHFTTYTYNSNFGAGQDLGNGNFVLSITTEAFVTVHQLEPGTAYHFAIFELNGFNQPLYLLPAAVTSASTLATLPVKLTNWEAIPGKDKVKLQWTTSSEINASHFIIERSADGIHFSAISTVQAIGNSQSDINYSKEDNDPLPGKSYYRLKMVDIDTKSEYSTIRIVFLSATAMAKIAGNPVQNKLEIVSSATSSNSEWQIINLTGQTLKKGILNAGRTEVNVSSLAAGNYWLRLSINREIQTLAFIKQ
jgi:hypothetical protein